MPNRRDDFREPIKRRLALRAAYACSNPNCGVNTAGPSGTSAEGVIILGVAAHITAAAPGGPRYDDSLTSVERGHITNGIWLCQTCSRLIDADVATFTVPVLRDWKQQHEARVAATLLGRYAAIDAARIQRLADVTGNPANQLEEIVPVSDPPQAERSFRASARIVPQADSIYIVVTCTNLSEATTLRTLALVLPEREILLGGYCDVRMADGMWQVTERDTADLSIPMPAADETSVRFRVRDLSTLGELADAPVLASTLRIALAEGTHELPLTLYSNRSLSARAANKKLRPLQQWTCDTCGMPILCAKDGWLEWKITHTDDDGFLETGYRIVHHFLASPRPAGCYGVDDDGTMHLDHVVDAGVAWGLDRLGLGDRAEEDSVQRVGNVREWMILLRRLWVPFYEQGRQLIERAVADGVVDADEPARLRTSDVLERVIDRYVSEEYAPACEEP